MTDQPYSLPHYRLPAEWEPQSGVQLTWPHADTDWLPYLEEITQTCVELARAIASYEPVIIAAQHPAEVAAHFTPDELRHISIYPCENNDTWARDHAFITLLPTEQGMPARLLDFRFNGWGEKFRAEKDNRLNAQLYAAAAFKGTCEDHNDFVLEGGSIESDGRGTVFTTSMCLLAPHRNQPLSQAEIENELKRRLHCQRVVWLDHGELIGDDTDGHIDTIVRTAPGDTLLYVGCDDEGDPQHADFMALERQLATLRTDEGRPYRLLKLPMPTPIYDDGDRLPATYANFLIVNGAVIYPTYAQPDNDREAERILREAFPRHELIGIDARTVIRQHGSLHCMTMQYPVGVIKTD